MKIEKSKKIEEDKKKNQSKDSWKEEKQNTTNTSNTNNNNQKYKKSKYKGHNNYTSNYNPNHSSRYYYQNKKQYKHGKKYKSYNRQKNYIEREIEFNSKGEIDNENIEDNSVEKNGSLSPQFSADSSSKNSKEVNSQENTEETSNLNNIDLDMLNLNLSKCQSEELNHKNFDLLDVGIKLFPGIYKNKNFNIDIGKNNSNYINVIKNEDDIKKTGDLDNYIEKNNSLNIQNDCKKNFLHKNNGNISMGQHKNGLALAFD